jgi:hypothetical protein
MNRCRLASLCVFVFALTSAAQDVPPPPKPADDGPSLADTMKFIEEKLGSIGQVNYVAYLHDDTSGKDFTPVKYGSKIEISTVRGNVQSCRIDYHGWGSVNGTVLLDKDLGFALKDVQEVVVKACEQDLKEAQSKAGHPEYSNRVDPPVFVIIVKKKNGGDEFALYDESLAHRIAKALVHAVELCGGGSKDPF